jgi:hypothetical protein
LSGRKKEFMYSNVLEKRLSGIQKSLISLYESGGEISSATRGREREQFIELFLKNVFPPSYRFGSGDAIDTEGNKSGQLDVVVEFTFLPSIPALGSEPRVYLAEGIAAVIEVKSNVSNQWNEVISTSKKLQKLKRVFRAPGFTPYGPPQENIPIFAVGYTGWKNISTVKEKANSGVVDGILVIDQGLFCTRQDFPNGLWVNDGPKALWALISCLHLATNSIVMNSFSPLRYIQ